jgi:hypothetical protein
MRKTNSNSTKPTPLTQEELERRSNLLCRKMEKYGICSFGDRCHYSHEMTRPVYDRRSHKREPSPPKEEPQTEEKIIQELLDELSFGGSARKYLGRNPTMSFLQALVVFNKSLALLVPSDESTLVDNQSLVDAMTLLMSSSNNDALTRYINKNVVICSTDDIAYEVHKGFREAFALPDEVMCLFDVRETETGEASYAGKLKVNQLELAKRTPDAIPSKEFLDYLSSTCGLSTNTGFMTMRKNHELTGGYQVRHFIAILTLFEADKEVCLRLEALKRQEDELQQEADVKVALMRECLTAGNPHLKTAFNLLTSLSELTAFAKALSEEDQKVLISVFGSFVAYLSHQVQMNLSFKITRDSLTTSFKSFTKSRCVDHESHKLKSGFCDFVKTPEFIELRKLLGAKTSSVQRKSKEILDVGEIFKRMLKEILPSYLDKVKPENRDQFCIDLVKHLLPFAYLVFLAPSHSYMLSGQWKKGYMHEGKLVEVYDYAEMSNGKEKSEKSILYWLLQGLRSKDTSSKKYSSIYSFAKLSSLFTSLEPSCDGESKQVFSPDLLFDALNEVLKTNFLKAGNFPVTMQSLENQKSSLFKMDDESKVLSVSVSESVAYCLYLGYGSSQDDLKTRQFSDMTALFKCDRMFLVEIVSSWTSSSYGSSSEKSIAILRTMKFENQSKKIVNAMEAFMKLLEESKRDDLLRRAYDIMSLANKVVEIQGTMFFMSLVDALLVVLLQDKLNKVKFLDIMNIVYMGKNDMKEMKISFPKVKTYCETLDAPDTMKQRLRDLLCEGDPRSDEKELKELGKVVQVLEPLLCKKDLPDESIHGCLKRGMPFILNSFSMTLLLGTVSGFERVEADDAPPDITNWLTENVQSFFNRELELFISGQANKISFDLCKRMKDATLPSDRLKLLGFVKFQSSIVNLINSMMSSIGLPYSLTHETFSANFPKTTRCKNPEELIANHVMKVLSSSDGEVVQFTEQMRSLLQPLILKAVHAVCRTEVPKSNEKTVKVDTVLLSVVKTELGKSTTMDYLFEMCLQYWKLDLSRELILGVLQHFFSTANVKLVRELHTLVLKYDVQFTTSELKTYDKLFTFLRSTDESIPINESDTPYETSDDDFLQTMLDSIQSDHWNDTKQVELCKPLVKKSLRGIRIQRVREPDSGMAVGREPAPAPVSEEPAPAPAPVLEEPETVSEDDSDHVDQSKGPCDIATLRELLESNNKEKAIEYLNSVLLDDDDTLLDIFNYLGSEDSECAEALEAVNQSFE